MRNLSRNLRDLILSELIDLRNKLKDLARRSENSRGEPDPDDISEFESWKFQTQSLLKRILSETDSRISIFNQRFFGRKGKSSYLGMMSFLTFSKNPDRYLPQTIGIFDSIIDEFKKGFFDGFESIISGEIFDSILETGKYLLSEDYKDAAAIYGRIILEQTLKKLCNRQEPPLEFDETTRTSTLNDLLKKKRVLTQPEWRQNQAWLDIGNNAAHGNFNVYNEDDVKRMLDGLTEFIAKKL